MSFDTWIALIGAVLVLAYLLFTLVRPEKF
jgi:hypothetical protein